MFDVAADGSLLHPRVLVDGVGSSDPNEENLDGMKCDELGNIWTTGPGGLWVFAPEGELLGMVAVPNRVLNLAWGGDEWRSLFITCVGAVHMVETRVASVRLPYHAAWA